MAGQDNRYDAGQPSQSIDAHVGYDLKSAVGAELNRTRARRRRFWLVVLVVALVVLLCALSALGAIAFSYVQGQQKYAEIAETADFDEDDFTGEEPDIQKLTVDWDALKQANPDTVAWLYLPGTVINYPVVQGQDNEHYLYYDFDGDAGWLAEYGAIFMDYQNKRDWSDPSYFIYGHHMNDGSMFAALASLQDQARFDECRTVYLLTPQGNYKLRTYALVHCPASEPIVLTDFVDKKEMAEYVQDKMDRSIVDAGAVPKANEITKSFAFATCDEYSSGRYVLFAYVVDTSVDDLEGQVGLAEDGDGTSGFVDDLNVEG